MKQRKATRTALALSVFLFVFWVLLGTNATVAWFSDTTQTAKNTFIIGELDLHVEYKNGFATTYADMKDDSAVFNECALYEPGYTQVVWLKIENKGTVAVELRGIVGISAEIRRGCLQENQCITLRISGSLHAQIIGTGKKDRIGCGQRCGVFGVRRTYRSPNVECADFYGVFVA